MAPGAVVGSVLSVRDLQTDADNFYVLLRNGVQPISPFVASLLRSANSFGDELPVVVAPDRLASVPVVETLPVDYYPTTRLELVDTATDPVTCLNWSKGSTDRSAETVVLSGKGLPVPIGSDNRLLRLVKNDRSAASIEADQVYMSPGATNLVMTTGAAPDATSRESMWWISDQGVRYGISLEDETLRALGHFTAHGATGAVAVDPGIRPRARAEPHRRDDAARHPGSSRGSVPRSPSRSDTNELDDRPQTTRFTGGDHGHAVGTGTVTERDDFLREHLSPPSDSGDAPAVRPPEPPRPSAQDVARPRNGVDDEPRPTGPDGDGRRAGDDAVRRPQEEPGRPAGPDDRRHALDGGCQPDPHRTSAHTARRLPAGAAAHAANRPTAPPPWRTGGPAHGGETGAAAPRGQAPRINGGRVHPGDAADRRPSRSSGLAAGAAARAGPAARPAGQDWSSQPSSSPNWAVAPAAAPPSTGYSYVDSIRTSELVPPKKVPPRKGWRRFIYRATFGLINLGPSPDEQRLADLENKIRSLLRGHYKIGVFGKGGVGKTTVAASVGSIFAELRQDDRVVAIDADTAFGKLGSRIDPNAAGSYWELAADEHLDTFADVRSRVGNNSAGPVRARR